MMSVDAARHSVRLVEPDVGAGFWPGYVPLPHQSRFHDSPAPKRLIGGAAGPGKTTALVAEATRLCRTEFGIHGYLMRRTIKQLKMPGSLVATFRDNVPQSWYTWNQTDLKATFTSTGSTLSFVGCEHEADVYGFRSGQLNFCGIDEVTEWTYDMVATLWSRIRSARKGKPTSFFAATNPGNIGHDWVKRLWPYPDPEFAAEHRLNLAQFEFVGCLVDDNPYLLEADPGYIERLAALPEADFRAQRYGDWFSFTGQFFKEWRQSLNICEPFAIPKGWLRWTATDYGGTAPWVTLWFAADPACDPPRIYVYREYHRAGADLEYNVPAVLSLSAGERYAMQVCDPEVWARDQETGAGRVAIELQIRRLGLRFTQANNDRAGGWSAMKTQLKPQSDGGAGLVFFSTCSNSIRTIPSLVHDDHAIEDMKRTGNPPDHCADAARYGVVAYVGRQRASAPMPGARRDAALAASVYGGL